MISDAARPPVTMVAPFQRDLPFGGSIRATAIAEGLESVGRRVAWMTLAPSGKPVHVKMGGLLRGVPPVVTYHSAGLPRALAGPAMIAHSYLANAVCGGAPRVLDWHNLEWVYLRKLAAAAAMWMRPYLLLQVALMRRFELEALAAGSAHTFCTQAELAWASGQPHGDQLRLLPHQLPTRMRDSLERVLRQRDRGVGSNGAEGRPRLLYVGKLTYPANALSLLRFLDECWVSARRAFPGLVLWVAGEVSTDLRARLREYPQAIVLGPVDDLGPLLGSATAAVLPFYGGGGASLRLLTYAAAGVPTLILGGGARGYPDTVFPSYHNAADFVAGLQSLIGRSGDAASQVARAHDFYKASVLGEDQWLALSALL